MKRTYDIGHGVTVEDDGHTLSARWAINGGSTSIGVTRPSMKPIPDELDATFSESEEHFYLDGFGLEARCWLGTKVWESEEALKAGCRPGIGGVESVRITHDAGTSQERVYWREMMSFAMWEVRRAKAPRKLKCTEDLARDYLLIAQTEVRQQESRFNQEIAFTGRTLGWIAKRIGPWVEPETVPTVVLTD